MKIVLGLFIIILSFTSFSQITYQYDENGKHTVHIIDLGREVLADATLNDCLTGEPKLPLNTTTYRHLPEYLLLLNPHPAETWI